jgi:hypothetical protein
MCFSVALLTAFFLCGKRAFLCGESNSSSNKTEESNQIALIQLTVNA